MYFSIWHGCHTQLYSSPFGFLIIRLPPSVAEVLPDSVGLEYLYKRLPKPVSHLRHRNHESACRASLPYFAKEAPGAHLETLLIAALQLLPKPSVHTAQPIEYANLTKMLTHPYLLLIAKWFQQSERYQAERRCLVP